MQSVRGKMSRIVGLLATFLSAMHPSDGRAAGYFNRGIAIAHTLAWAPVEPAPSRQFVFPPFSDIARSLTRDELIALRSAGFDFVRLAVDPGPLLQFQGARRDALDRIIEDHVRLILSSGLSVIVDFHPSDLNPDYTSQALTAGTGTPLFQSYLGLLGRTATWLASMEAGRVALEIMNEPAIRSDAWQPMLEAGYAAVRAQAPTLPIVIGGGDEGSAEGLMQLATRKFGSDPGVLFSFHFYDPYQFTHQGASWNAARYLADVPYPANAHPLEESLRATASAIEASRLPGDAKTSAYVDALKQLTAYRLSGFGREAIAGTFARVTRWGEDHGIPPARILLGEFGAMRTDRERGGPRAVEREAWFRDVRGEAERRGFGWAVWVYRGSEEFALVRSQSDTVIDAAILAALGMSVQKGDAAK